MANPTGRGGGALAVGILALALGACGPEPEEAPSPRLESVRVLDIAPGEQSQAVDVGGGPGGVPVSVREIVLKPGSGTGPHCHHGRVVLVVTEGALTHHSDSYPGGVRVYRAGESVVETARHVYEGANEGPGTLVVNATYATPAGKPVTELDLTECER